MEYLALGKDSKPAVTIVRRPRKWTAVLLAAVCLAVGVLIGHSWTAEDNINSDPSALSQSTLENLDSVAISNVTVSPLVGKSKFEIAILPSVLWEGMGVTVLCENKIYDTSESISCTFDGNYYRVTLPRNGSFHYFITAVITLTDSHIQIPILEVDGDNYDLSYTHLWENQ